VADQPAEREAPAGRGWAEVWLAATTRPGVETFQELLAEPGVSARRALTWAAATFAAGGALIALLTIVTRPELGFPPLALPLSAVLGGVAGVVGFAAGIGLIHIFALLLGGMGSYEQLLYAVSAFALPMSLVSIVINAIPGVDVIGGLLVSLYGYALLVMAIRAVHDFAWWRAVVSSLIVLSTFALGVLGFAELVLLPLRW